MNFPSINEGIQKWLVYDGKSIYKWIIWGYPYFRKPPYEQTIEAAGLSHGPTVAFWPCFSLSLSLRNRMPQYGPVLFVANAWFHALELRRDPILPYSIDLYI